jgi:hypothetical protein
VPGRQRAGQWRADPAGVHRRAGQVPRLPQLLEIAELPFVVVSRPPDVLDHGCRRPSVLVPAQGGDRDHGAVPLRLERSGHGVLGVFVGAGHVDPRHVRLAGDRFAFPAVPSLQLLDLGA